MAMCCKCARPFRRHRHGSRAPAFMVVAVGSKLKRDGRVVVIANPTEPALPPGRVFKVRPIDSTQEPKRPSQLPSRKPDKCRVVISPLEQTNP